MQFCLVVAVCIVALVSLAVHVTTLTIQVRLSLGAYRPNMLKTLWKDVCSHIKCVLVIYIGHILFLRYCGNKKIGTCLARHCRSMMRLLCWSPMLVLRERADGCGLAASMCVYVQAFHFSGVCPSVGRSSF